MVTFGTKLIELREFNKDTQEKLAEKLSISVQTLRRWEHDKNPPDINQLKLICEIYKVNPDYFFNEGTPDVKQTQITEGNEIGVSKDIWVQKKHKYKVIIILSANFAIISLMLIVALIIINQIIQKSSPIPPNAVLIDKQYSHELDKIGILLFFIFLFLTTIFISLFITFIPFEYASNSVSPYYYAEGNLIYGAPTYYYKQTQTSLTKNTAEKFYLQEIISNEEVILNENTFNNFKAYNIQTIKALEDSNITTNENLINPYGQSTPYGGYYIENYEYVSKIEDFAYNHSGICTYVAAAIILYYTQRQFGGNFINTSFMTNNGFTVDLVNELLSIAKSLGVGNATHAVEFKKVMQKYTETRVPNATHYSMALSTALNIDLCFRDNKPVMLCGNFQDVSSSSGKVNHTIVAFGRSETVSGIYKNRYYHVNYGWRGYTDVTIMDNIFLNPIGSMYNLNPLG